MSGPELLLPVGEPRLLDTAIRYGADAVYIGGSAYSLRAQAPNFTIQELADAVSAAHGRGVRVYVTANIMAREDDLTGAAAFFRELNDVRPDGILVADPGMFRLAQGSAPDVPLHISTQANNVNSATVRFWADMGARRVVLGRELSLDEIVRIREAVPAELCELEVFVHGAMCMSYSGRCLLSNVMTGRDANRGDCTQPCRWHYALMEETRPGEYMPIEQDERGSYILSAGDLRMVRYVRQLADAGVDSLKVEGRMKNALYVACVGRAYRRMLDAADEESYDGLLTRSLEDLELCAHRPYTTGFFFGRPGEGEPYPDMAGRRAYEARAIYLGTVQDSGEGRFLVEQRNKFSIGDMVTVLRPHGEDMRGSIKELTTEEGEPRESAPHPAERLWICLDNGMTAEAGDVLYKEA